MDTYVGAAKNEVVTVLSTFLEERMPRRLALYAELSDGRQLRLRWDDSHGYVGLSLHVDCYSEAIGPEVTDAEVPLAPGLLEQMTDQVSRAAEAWHIEHDEPQDDDCSDGASEGSDGWSAGRAR